VASPEEGIDSLFCALPVSRTAIVCADFIVAFSGLTIVFPVIVERCHKPEDFFRLIQELVNDPASQSSRILLFRIREAS
jgi:hypothetical protein